MDNFCLSAEIDRYVKRITADIRSAKKRREVGREYAEHIEDAVYHGLLDGMTEKEALEHAMRCLGDTDKNAALLAAVHNKDRLPSYVRFGLWLLLGIGVVLSYFLIDHRSYRAWLLLALQLSVLALGIFLLYTLWRLISCLSIRRKAVTRLVRYARENGLMLTKHQNAYRSLFSPASLPSFCLDTPACRYQLFFFPTFWRKKHLCLSDNGLYSYASMVGYTMLYTRAYSLFPNFGYLHRGHTLFPLFHSSLVEVPKGMHLMPEMDFDTYAHSAIPTESILLLNPIPFKISGMRAGRAKSLGDGEWFENYRIFSMSGFLSELEGERIATNGRYDRMRKKR